MATIHDERAREISKRLREVLAKAAEEVFEDEAIGAKYVALTDDGYRIGFKEGMGYEIVFREIYRPGSAD